MRPVIGPKRTVRGPGDALSGKGGAAAWREVPDGKKRRVELSLVSGPPGGMRWSPGRTFWMGAIKMLLDMESPFTGYPRMSGIPIRVSAEPIRYALEVISQPPASD